MAVPKKISQLTEHSSAPGSSDVLPVNISGVTKKNSILNFFAWLLATARTFTAAPVIETGAAGASPLIIRQTGGTAGEDEGAISNDGSATNIISKNTAANLSGLLYIKDGSDNIIATFRRSYTTPQMITSTVCLAVGVQDTIGYVRLAILGAEGVSCRIANESVSLPIWCAKSVEANTAGSGAPNALGVLESRKLLTNEGTAAENYHTLPSAAAGHEFEFYAEDSDGIRVTAAAGDLIRFPGTGTASATAGFIRLPQYAYAKLVAINATEWIVVQSVGTITVDA